MFAIFWPFFHKVCTVQVEAVTKSMVIKGGPFSCLVKLCFLSLSNIFFITPKYNGPELAFIDFIWFWVIYSYTQFYEIWVYHREGVPQEENRNVPSPGNRFIEVVEKKHFISVV